MNNAKPVDVSVIAACAANYHRVCPKQISTKVKDYICSCPCHHREENTMEDTATTTQTAMVRKPWSDSEVAFLQANASKGAQLLAMELGRSTSQVRSKAMQLGLSLRQPGSTRGRKKTQA